MHAKLADLLKSHFGYSSFRPLQWEIMEAALADRDTLAILPTGAGKSLCYQLPALAREGVTLVVSPLIALMKDQVDQLTASGVAATFLNSTLDPRENRSRLDAIRAFYSESEEHEMRAALQDYTEDSLKPVFEHLGGRISYGKLRLFRAFEACDAALA